ncbi:MAG: DUF86 domain-containing protein, partial [Curvibacter lanceolatus]|uniref:HepT-like ribonuclease domain-containing protein n=1 Tax=Curvibacter lanceolatus TaxID=86182 RepID=UPI0023576608
QLMSDTKPNREWRFYLDDMIGFCQKVISFTVGLDQTQFVKNDMCFDATIRNIELIGEAATHIPESVRAASPDIPWRMVIATRNQMIHGYLGIDNDTLWSIIQTDIPMLLTSLIDLKAKFSNDHP